MTSKFCLFKSLGIFRYLKLTMSTISVEEVWALKVKIGFVREADKNR